MFANIPVYVSIHVDKGVIGLILFTFIKMRKRNLFSKIFNYFSLQSILKNVQNNTVPYRNCGNVGFNVLLFSLKFCESA